MDSFGNYQPRGYDSDTPPLAPKTFNGPTNLNSLDDVILILKYCLWSDSNAKEYLDKNNTTSIPIEQICKYLLDIIVNQPDSEQKNKLNTIYKMICDEINESMAIDRRTGSFNNCSANVIAKYLFGEIYPYDHTIALGISQGLWGSFKRTCLKKQLKKDDNYFTTKMARTKKLFGFGGKKGKKVKRTRRTKNKSRRTRSRR